MRCSIPTECVALTVDDDEMVPLELCAVGERRALGAEVGDHRRLSLDVSPLQRVAECLRQIGLIVSKELREHLEDDRRHEHVRKAARLDDRRVVVEEPSTTA